MVCSDRQYFSVWIGWWRVSFSAFVSPRLCLSARESCPGLPIDLSAWERSIWKGEQSVLVAPWSSYGRKVAQGIHIRVALLWCMWQLQALALASTFWSSYPAETTASLLMNSHSWVRGWRSVLMRNGPQIFLVILFRCEQSSASVHKHTYAWLPTPTHHTQEEEVV